MPRARCHGPRAQHHVPTQPPRFAGARADAPFFVRLDVVLRPAEPAGQPVFLRVCRTSPAEPCMSILPAVLHEHE